MQYVFENRRNFIVTLYMGEVYDDRFKMRWLIRLWLQGGQLTSALRKFRVTSSHDKAEGIFLWVSLVSNMI